MAVQPTSRVARGNWPVDSPATRLKGWSAKIGPIRTDPIRTIRSEEGATASRRIPRLDDVGIGRRLPLPAEGFLVPPTALVRSRREQSMQHRSSPNPRTQDKGRPGPGPWGDLFARSTIHPRIFFLKGSRGRYADISGYHEIKGTLIDLGIPYRFGARRGAWDAWEHGGFGFLDGGLFEVTSGDGFGFGGVYVLGVDALRLVCHETGLVPPRRLKGEDRMPADHDELRAMLTTQLDDPDKFAHLRLIADTLWSANSGGELAAVLDGTARLRRYAPNLGHMDTTSGPEVIVDKTYDEVMRARRPKPEPPVKREPPPPEPEPSLSDAFLCLTCTDVHGHHRDKELRCRCQPRDDGWREANWKGWDIPETIAVCTMCCRTTVKSGTRWSWIACEHCREASEAIGTAIAGRKAVVLRFGRHSIMNGIALSPDPAKIAESVDAITKTLEEHRSLAKWAKAETARLAQSAGFHDDVPLEDWLAAFDPSLGNSIDAICRYKRVDIRDVPNADHLVKAWKKRDKTVTKGRKGG